MYNDISTKKILPENITVVTGYYCLDDDDKELIPDEFKDCIYKKYKNIDNKLYHSLENAPLSIYYKDIKNDIARFVSHVDKQYKIENPEEVLKLPSELIKLIVISWSDYTLISNENAKSLLEFLEKNYALIDEDNPKEESRYLTLCYQIKSNDRKDEVLSILSNREPLYILFNNYFKVKPSVHLEHLASRTE